MSPKRIRSEVDVGNVDTDAGKESLYIGTIMLDEFPRTPFACGAGGSWGLGFTLLLNILVW